MLTCADFLLLTLFWSVLIFSSALGTTPLTATAAMPGSTMKIFYGEPGEGAVAENVKIGDPLSLVVSIDEQVRQIGVFYIQKCFLFTWYSRFLVRSKHNTLKSAFDNIFKTGSHCPKLAWY